MSLKRVFSIVLILGLYGCGEIPKDVLVLDYGSPATPKIIERLEFLKVTHTTREDNLSPTQIRQINPKAIILSGSPASVLDKDHPKPAAELYTMGIPVLGLCYGLQLMADQLGGKVERCPRAEHGIYPIKITGKCDLIPEGLSQLDVWMFHEDCVTALPPDFDVVAHGETAKIAIACNPKKRLYGVQFHPERFDKAPEAALIIDRFIRKFVIELE